MTLPKFNYLAPKDLEEASAALNDYNGRIAVFAGGTELVMHLKWRIKTPDYLLSLKNLTELRTIQYDENSGFTLGAAVSLRNLGADASIKSELPALAQAADRVAIPQIRGMATIGGNICLDTRCWYHDRTKEWRTTFPPCYKAGGDRCHVVKGGKQCYALFQADTVPCLLILKAKLKLVHFAGERIIPIEEFYSGFGKVPNRVSSNEILTQIHIPKLPPHSGTAYLKWSKRKTLEFPILGIACQVRLDTQRKRCEEARFALTGCDSKLLSIEATELLMDLNEPVIPADLVDHLLREVKPVAHMGVSAHLKRRICRVLIQKAFYDSWKMAQRSKTGFS